jgi:hypothetical protein
MSFPPPPPLLDVDNDTAGRYGTFGSLPTSYFVKLEGEITAVHSGSMAREQLEGYLAMNSPG